MPFNNPLRKPSSSRNPSPPQRNPSTSSSATASSTSSLEAAPIKPPPIQTRTAASSDAQLPDPAEARRQVERQDETIRARAKRDSMSTSPTTPRQQRFPIPAEFPSHLLPAELRSSSSGPDLVALRARAAENRDPRLSMALSASSSSTVGGMIMADPRPKLRTRSSSAQVTQVISQTVGPGAPKLELRRAVTFQDFTFGEVLGRGSYSTVVLAQQKASQLSYAIKILDQHHLIQEKKTKYAIIERDALVLLGPRASAQSRRGSGANTPSQSTSPGMLAPASALPAVPNGRRGSHTDSVRSFRSEKGKKREIEVAVGPGRRGASVEPANRNSYEVAENGRVVAQNAPAMSQAIGSRRPSNVEEHEAEELQPVTAPQDIKRPRAVGSPTSPTSTDASFSLTDRTITPGTSQSTSNMAFSPQDRQPHPRRGSEVSDNSGRIFMGANKGGKVEKRKRRLRLSHPGVVRLHYTFKDDQSLYFVLDLAVNGELLGYIRKFGSLDIDSARIYAAQIIDVVDFMHERGVIHRDLKPENILLDDDMRVKITDFGSAKMVDPTGNGDAGPSEESRKRSFVGTAEYVSPEVLRNEHATFASDVWAFGAVLYQLIAGKPAFRGATEYLTFQKVLKAEFDFPDGFDPEAKDLIEKILKLDPSERLSVEHIQAHPFFATVDFQTLWTDQMPEIKTGIHAPAPPPTMRFSSSAWDTNGNDAESDQDEEADDPFSGDYDDLGTPRRRWIESGGGVGTFSSGSAGTDDSVSLVGGAMRPQSAEVLPSQESPDIVSPRPSLLTRRRSSAQWALKDKKDIWSQHLLKNEKIVYSSPILSRSGLFLPKRRTLVLTNFPRLICVKEDASRGQIKVKIECVFNSRPSPLPTVSEASSGNYVDSDQAGTKRTTQVLDLVTPRSVTEVVKKGPRAFIVKTPEKEHTFIADREDIRQRWLDELEKISK